MFKVHFARNWKLFSLLLSSDKEYLSERSNGMEHMEEASSQLRYSSYPLNTTTAHCQPTNLLFHKIANIWETKRRILLKKKKHQSFEFYLNLISGSM